MRARVVGLVHRDGFGIVIDRDVRGPAESYLDAEGGTASACEVVDDQFAFM